MMVGRKAVEPDVTMVSRFAYAAGTAGILVGLPAYLGFPVWFVILGRHLGASVG